MRRKMQQDGGRLDGATRWRTAFGCRSAPPAHRSAPLAQRHCAFAGDDYEMDEKENEPLDCSSNSESPARKRPCRSQPSVSIVSTTLVNKQTVDRTLCGTGAAAVRLMPMFASAFRGRTASECSHL